MAPIEARRVGPSIQETTIGGTMTRYLRGLRVPLATLALSGLVFACGDDGGGGDSDPDAEVDDTPDAEVDDTPDAAPEPDAEPQLTGLDALRQQRGQAQGYDSREFAFEVHDFSLVIIVKAIV